MSGQNGPLAFQFAKNWECWALTDVAGSGLERQTKNRDAPLSQIRPVLLEEVNDSARLFLIGSNDRLQYGHLLADRCAVSNERFHIFRKTAAAEAATRA